MRDQELFTDYATYKRTQWVKEIQQTSWVELMTFWDILAVFVLLQIITAILVIA